MRSSLRVALLFIAAASAQRPGWRKGTWVAGVDAPAEVRETWAARPPMRGPPPDERRSPVVAPNASAAGPYRAPAPLGAPLWAEPSHRVDRDVITGLALNYKEYSHRAFVGSARRAGYRGDIVLITEPKLFRGCAEYLRSMGVVAYGLEPDCRASASSNIKHKTCEWRDGQPALPLAIIRHALYLAIASLYGESSNFYVADYRDTFFQADPFARVAARRGRRLEGLELLLVAVSVPRP